MPLKGVTDGLGRKRLIPESKHYKQTRQEEEFDTLGKNQPF